MSLAVSSLPLLPALLNSLHSCLNNLIRTMSVFNPAPLTAINLATWAVKTQQLLCRIYLWGPSFTLVPPPRGLGVGESQKRHNRASRAAGRLHAAPCVVGHQLPRYYPTISDLRNKVKMGKAEMLPGLCSSTVTAIKGLVFSHPKSTSPVLGKALGERALRLLGWILDGDISKFKMSAI